MRPTRKTTALALAACTLPALASQAAELQQPTQLYTAGIAANPPSNAANPPGSLTNCPALSASGPISPGRLVIRDTDRPDVGPYTVKLPGYATDPASSATDSYRPFLVTASPGDTLRFDIVNQLDPAGSRSDITNLHTHGLIVSPRPCVPLGDYVFVEDKPGTTTYYRMDIPATLPGYMFGSQATPRPYPSGLNWFHAHVHGQARIDVMAGQAGMLYVGDLRRDLLEAPNLTAASTATLDRTDTLYLGLRDIQLAVPPGATPDAAKPGQRAEPLFGVDYDPKACPAQANPPQPGTSTSGPGYCASPGVTIEGKSYDRVWLHTINGQHNPTITLQPGRNQIWRIANLSANVTYVLELDDAAGQAQTLNALSIDGLVAGTSVPGGTSLRVGVKLRQLLLMPASRAELFVANIAGAETRPFTLRTTGFTTGPDADPWPQVELAQVVMQPSPSELLANARTNSAASTVSSLTATDPAQVPLDIVLPDAAPTSDAPSVSLPAAATDLPNSATSQSGSSTNGLADSATRRPGPNTPINCVTLPTAGNTPTRRRIRFVSPKDAFALGSAVVDVNGKPVDKAHTIEPQQFPMQAMLEPNSVKHVCPRLGEQEVWELVNETGELHNFHLHQSKFRLTVQSDRGAPPNLMPIQDPTGLVAQYESEVQGNAPATRVNAWHDVLPVPPAALKADGSVKTPGRTFVTIPFYARQQVGDFVYHCHILEHEDGGMMAVVQIYDPWQLAANDQPTDFASLIRGSICSVPPTGP